MGLPVRFAQARERSKRGYWHEARSPVGYRPFVDACVESGEPLEATEGPSGQQAASADPPNLDHIKDDGVRKQMEQFIRENPEVMAKMKAAKKRRAAEAKEWSQRIFARAAGSYR